jgi:hypothetical protein
LKEQIDDINLRDYIDGQLYKKMNSVTFKAFKSIETEEKSYLMFSMSVDGDQIKFIMKDLVKTISEL